jgi:hypothetical protein
VKGFEPSTPGTTTQCSNQIELHSPQKNHSGAPEGIRTPDLRLRRPLLYPPELLAQNSKALMRAAGANLRRFGIDFSLLTLMFLVGARRFELPTPCAQGRCATRLRYAPS